MEENEVEQEKKGICAEEYARLTLKCGVEETDAKKYSEILKKEIKVKEKFRYLKGKETMMLKKSFQNYLRMIDDFGKRGKKNNAE